MKLNHIYYSSISALALILVFTFQNCAPSPFASEDFSSRSSSYSNSGGGTTGFNGGSSSSGFSTGSVNQSESYVAQPSSSSTTNNSVVSSSTTTSSSSSSSNSSSSNGSSSSQGSFGGGSSGVTAPTIPSITTATILTYEEALSWRKKIMDKGRSPYVFSHGPAGFGIMSYTSLDTEIITRLSDVRTDLIDGDWTRMVGHAVNDIAAAMGYMPNDVYKAVVANGLTVNNPYNGTIVGVAVSMGCKTGVYTTFGSKVQWSCNCSGNFAGWNGMGALNCVQKLVK